jgi:hypothetical protein
MCEHLLGAIVVTAMLFFSYRNRGVAVLLRKVVLPLALVLVPTAGATAYYNALVTETR